MNDNPVDDGRRCNQEFYESRVNAVLRRMRMQFGCLDVIFPDQFRPSVMINVQMVNPRYI